MASQLSHQGSSIFRYRPGIIAILVVAVGCTGYYIHTTLAASSVSEGSKPVKNGRLHRSNAVRRARPIEPPVMDRETRRSRSIDPPVMDWENLSLLLSPICRGAFHYGDYTASDSHGRAIQVNLINKDLMSAPRLVEAHGINYRDAVRIREEVEAAFLDAFFARAMPLGPILHFTEDACERLVEKLGSENNLSPQKIEDALDRYAKGALEDHPNRIESRAYADAEPRQYRQLIEQLRDHNEPANRYPDPSTEHLGPSTTEQDLGYIPQPHDADDGHSGLEDEQPSVATGQGNIGETTYEADLPPETTVSLSEHEDGDDPDDHKKQTALTLLFRIAEEQARHDGYIHRGVSCNRCSMLPIKGIRYRCTNCADYDVCEQCESMQEHDPTHLFYKVKIPAPFLGRARKPQPVCYPGKPQVLEDPLDKEERAILCQRSGLEEPVLDALWIQFKCLAATHYPNDPLRYYQAIDRATFDRCFIPNSNAWPPPPNLVYDRIFSFYDADGDGLIGFHDFVFGVQCISFKKPEDRLRQVFNGFDMDNNKLISRVDVQRMFKALFLLHSKFAKDTVFSVGDDPYDEDDARDVVNGSQALSSAFSGDVGTANPSRLHEGKERNEYGDYVIADGSIEPVKPEDSTLQHEPEVQDYGHEILHDVIHDSINEMLDPLFKFREDMALEVLRTKAARLRFQARLAELRKAGFWICMEFMIKENQEQWASKGQIPYDKPQDFFDSITALPLFQAWTPSSRIRQREKRLAETWEPLKALGWDRGAPKLPDTIDEVQSNDRLLVDFLRNLEPSLSSEQYDKFCKLSIDHERLLSTNPGAVSVENFGTQESVYEFSDDNRPTDSTLPQNRPFTTLVPDLGPSWYKYLSLMELLEKRDTERGGPGRIDFEEFEGMMTGPKKEELKFLGSWLEMAVF